MLDREKVRDNINKQVEDFLLKMEETLKIISFLEKLKLDNLSIKNNLNTNTSNEELLTRLEKFIDYVDRYYSSIITEYKNCCIFNYNFFYEK